MGFDRLRGWRLTSLMTVGVVIFAVFFADFSANFTGEELDTVYIPIRGVGEQRISDCVEITRGYVLTGERYRQPSRRLDLQESR